MQEELLIAHQQELGNELSKRLEMTAYARVLEKEVASLRARIEELEGEAGGDDA